MISSSFLVITFFFLNCLTKNNPVKMKMSLMFSSLVIFVSMKVFSSNSWMPFIFSMLYLGGILMMFMILSSFSPNSKMNSTPQKLILIFFIFMVSYSNSIFSLMSVSNLKVFMEEKINFLFMTLWILFVFFGFIWILGDCRLSMRSLISN